MAQIPKKCKETSFLMWLSLILFILILFVCWNLFCTIANLRIKCLTETKNVSIFYYMTHKHIWVWDFFTFLVVLAHSVAPPVPPVPQGPTPLTLASEPQLLVCRVKPPPRWATGPLLAGKNKMASSEYRVQASCLSVPNVIFLQAPEFRWVSSTPFRIPFRLPVQF